MHLIFKSLGYLVYWVTGFWGVFILLHYLNDNWGFWGVIGGIALAPITCFVTPFYMGFVDGDWFLLILAASGIMISSIFHGLGEYLAKRD
jgi:hypothetical protein